MSVDVLSVIYAQKSCGAVYHGTVLVQQIISTFVKNVPIDKTKNLYSNCDYRFILTNKFNQDLIK
jgi:hypothetical protein